MQTKQSLLYNDQTAWCKKNSNFDVTMGSFDGAETCELVGLYMLSQLEKLGINIGLYRDDGLATCNKTARETENIKKEICKIFAENKLNITIEANKKIIDFLDITIDLRTGVHKPFMKPNNTPLYVHNKSNHPPNIIKNIPESINRRLSNISSNEKIFKKAIPPYQDALKKSGYNYKLEYKPTPTDNNNQNNKQKNKRKRNITWFNPPYSKHVASNIGKQFLNLLDTCFPPTNKLHKILNRNTVKISYKCMPNMKQIISNHNKTILNKDNNTESKTNNCNCRIKEACPVNQKCQTSSLIYQATVTRHDNNKEESYIGLTDNTFKTRYNGHTSSFRNEQYRNATTLSKYIWTLKDKSINYSLKWKIIDRGRAYQPSGKNCGLCDLEKFYIISRPELASLNQRNELATSCRHRKKHLLCNK